MVQKKKGAYKIICALNLLQKAISSSVMFRIFFKWALAAFSSLGMGQSINISKPFGSPYLEIPPHSQVPLFFPVTLSPSACCCPDAVVPWYLAFQGSSLFFVFTLHCSPITAGLGQSQRASGMCCKACDVPSIHL